MIENAIYKELGVQPVIQAAGTKTTHGGTLIHPEVLEAMKLASQSFVSVEELNRKVGHYIAQITGAEAGMVTSGAASGIVLSIAACMTGTQISKVRQLPNTTGLKNELIIQRVHVGAYAHLYTLSGAKLIEVGNINDCLVEEVEAAVNENTVALNYLLGPRISRTGLSLKQMVEIGHRYKLPVIVDAAAMLPPRINLRRYIEEGADLVTISGGKMIQGPQGTGLLFGRKDLIEAAYANASPNHGIGRPHKVSKEEIVGLYVSLKRFMQRDEEVFFDECRQKLITIKECLRDLPGVILEIIHDGHNYNIPVLAIHFDKTWLGPSEAEFPKLLLNEQPRIFLQYFKELKHFVISPVSLQPGEPEILGKKIKEIFLRYKG